MSTKLDDVLDNYMKSVGYKRLGLENDDKDERQFIIDAAKKQIKKEIYDEISLEVVDKALKEAESKIECMADLKKISEYKKLALEGFFLAFFVGIFVNQVTEIIGFWKSGLPIENIYSTIIIAVVFLIICIVIFTYIFLKSLIELWGKVKKNATN